MVSSQAPSKPVELEEAAFSTTLCSQSQTPDDVTPYTPYTSVAEVIYTPEEALREGLRLVSALSSGISTLNLRNKMRQDVWTREINSLKRQGAPRTLIAMCGASGSGKSSALNALLNQNIVPTSGMHACTAVITEVSYHDKSSIEAEITFLTLEEWTTEIDVLLKDIRDPTGTAQSDIDVALAKILAVYPNLTKDTIALMSVTEIINHNVAIVKELGTKKLIVAENFESFNVEIARYIAAKEKKRETTKKRKRKNINRMGTENRLGKGATKGKPDAASMAAFFAAGVTVGDSLPANDLAPVTAEETVEQEIDQIDLNGPNCAYWPLIRQVRVRCNSKALSTGAVLVDLPGVADANAARNAVSKQYMQKCDSIWIFAPITRAVTDKTARDLLGEAFKVQMLMDGNYDRNTITFVATKCDDVASSEIIAELDFEDDAELTMINDKISTIEDQLHHENELYTAAEDRCNEIKAGLTATRTEIDKLEICRDTLENEALYERADDQTGTKRKGLDNSHEPSKRRRTDNLDSNSGIISVFHAEDDVVMSDEFSQETSTSSGTTMTLEPDDDEEEELSLTQILAELDKWQETKALGLEQYDLAIKQRQDAQDTITRLTRDAALAQKCKNAFCSLKRSKASQIRLKHDFREGLRELDNATAFAKDRENFDASVSLRDYANIELPVFAISSRDYVRLTGQAWGDGESSCFTNTADTGIPDLQKWCQDLTVGSRERSVRLFFHQLRVFAEQVETYVAGITDMSANDRQTLRDQWKSQVPDNGAAGEFIDVWDAKKKRPLRFPFERARKMKIEVREPPVNAAGQLIGIALRLGAQSGSVVKSTVEDLAKHFKDSLDEKCQAGAKEAAASAVGIHTKFAEEQLWQTYRATLRRRGDFRRDLNAELAFLMTRHIASSWAKAFETDIFTSFEMKTEAIIQTLLNDVESSAPDGLKPMVQRQGAASMKDAKITLQSAIIVVRDAMDEQQKELSRELTPAICERLLPAYLAALEETGKGAFARMKGKVNDSIEAQKDDMFNAGSNLLCDSLANIASTVGDHLATSLRELANKVENSLSVLWEESHDEPEQVLARADMVKQVQEIISVIDVWIAASQNIHNIPRPM